MAFEVAPIAAFLGGAAILTAGVVSAVEVASAIGCVLIGVTIVGLVVRTA